MDNEQKLWGSIYFSMSTLKSWYIYPANIEWMDPASEAKVNLYNIYDEGSSLQANHDLCTRVKSN